jgi:hypothetical protein
LVGDKTGTYGPIAELRTVGKKYDISRWDTTEESEEVLCAPFFGGSLRSSDTGAYNISILVKAKERILAG